MSNNDFIERCEEIIADYIETYFPGKSIPVPTDINPYMIWKDYWTEGSSQDQIRSNYNQKAIFGLETDIDKYIFLVLLLLLSSINMAINQLHTIEKIRIITNWGSPHA